MAHIDAFSSQKQGIGIREFETAEQMMSYLRDSLIASVELTHKKNLKFPESRVQMLDATLRDMPIIAESIARSFRNALKNNDLMAGRLRVYLVGGRTRVKEIDANTDFDFVITTEGLPSWNPKSAVDITPAAVSGADSQFNRVFQRIESSYSNKQLPVLQICSLFDVDSDEQFRKHRNWAHSSAVLLYVEPEDNL